MIATCNDELIVNRWEDWRDAGHTVESGTILSGLLTIFVGVWEGRLLEAEAMFILKSRILNIGYNWI